MCQLNGYLVNSSFDEQAWRWVRHRWTAGFFRVRSPAPAPSPLLVLQLAVAVAQTTADRTALGVWRRTERGLLTLLVQQTVVRAACDR